MQVLCVPDSAKSASCKSYALPAVAFGKTRPIPSMNGLRTKLFNTAIKTVHAVRYQAYQPCLPRRPISTLSATPSDIKPINPTCHAVRYQAYQPCLPRPISSLSTLPATPSNIKPTNPVCHAVRYQAYHLCLPRRAISSLPTLSATPCDIKPINPVCHAVRYQAYQPCLPRRAISSLSAGHSSGPCWGLTLGVTT